jgi:peptidoglycan/xylan/chitin deacetylase (PgdA/CDA1 family)
VLSSKVKSRSFIESPGGELLAWLSRRLSSRVPRIIVYHRFGDDRACTSAKGFERQLRYLKQYFNVVHLSRLVAALSGIGRVPRNCIVVTVDDGYADFYRIAFPLLCRYEIPCTFFVTTKFVAGRKWLWPDTLTWMLARCDRFPDLRVANQVVPGGNQTAAPRLWTHILGLLQQIDADEVEGSLRELAKQLCLEIPERPVAAFEACSWEQLLEMEASGYVEVGGHTRNHPILSRLDPVKLPDEIDGSLEDINARLGKKPRSFAYPNGQPADFNEVVRDAVVKSGFVSACATFYDDKHLNDRFALRRFSASDDFTQFGKATTGLQYWSARVLGRHNIDYKD